MTTTSEINEIQTLQFELIKRSSWNEFDGAAVVKSLEENRELWTAAVMHDDRLMSLRDIADGYWHADTLHILPAPGCEDALMKLAKKWEADEVSWIGGKEACDLLGSWSREEEAIKKKILRVWWD